MADATASVFADVRPKPRRLGPKERVAQFLSMDRQSRQQLYSEMGPEQYAEYLDDNMTQLVNMIGPAARNLMPYFYADGIPMQQSAIGGEAEAQQYLQALADGSMDDLIADELLSED